MRRQRIKHFLEQSLQTKTPLNRKMPGITVHHLAFDLAAPQSSPIHKARSRIDHQTPTGGNTPNNVVAEAVLRTMCLKGHSKV